MAWEHKPNSANRRRLLFRQKPQKALAQGFHIISTNRCGDLGFDLFDLLSSNCAPALAFVCDRHQLVAFACAIWPDLNHAMPDKAIDRLFGGLTAEPHFLVDFRQPNSTSPQLSKNAYIRGSDIREFGMGALFIHGGVPPRKQSHHQAFDVLPKKIVMFFINHG